MDLRVGVILFASVATVLACGVVSPAATPMSPTPAPPTETPAATAPTTSAPPSAAAPTAASPLPSGSGPCMAALAGDVTAYSRPSMQADIFSSSVPSPQEITSRTADGWLGFEPGVAQAANMGVFRLRWLAPDAAVSLSGNCGAVAIAAWVPKASVCYEMVMDSAEVRASPSGTSSLSGTLDPGDFAAILGRTASGWLSVSGDQANAPGVNGFIPDSEMNVNGACDSIPTVPG